MKEGTSKTPTQTINPRLKVLFLAYFYPPSDNRGVPGCMRTVKFVRALPNVDAYVVTSQKKVDKNADALRHLTLPVNNEKIYRVKVLDFFKYFLETRKKIKNLFQKIVTKKSLTFQYGKKIESVPHSRKSKIENLKDTIYHLVYLPDNASPWILPSIICGRRLIKKEGIDVIFATGSPWSCLVSGYFLSKFTGIPLIADFRDPWRGNPFDKSRGRIIEGINTALEKAVVNQASAVSLNTPPLMTDFRARYPDAEEKFFVMANGFDPNDFSSVKKHLGFSPDRIVLCHAGQLYGLRDPKALLKAIRLTNIYFASSGKKIIFQQIGNIDLNYDPYVEFKDLIEEQTFIVIPPTTYQESISLLNQSDILVNIQPSTKTQIPSKLYDYLALKKPIMNLTPADGALGQLAREHSVGELFSDTRPEQISEQLIKFIESESYSNFNGYDSMNEFDIQNIANKLYEVMTQITDRNDQSDLWN